MIASEVTGTAPGQETPSEDRDLKNQVMEKLVL